MAEAKKATAKTVQTDAGWQGPTLQPAGASHDPSVHQLLAERQTAVLNDDAERIALVDAQLADLGYAS